MVTMTRMALAVALLGILAATLIARIRRYVPARRGVMAEDDDAWDFDDIARNTREANPYGYWKDRAVMEAGITKDVLTALRLPFEQLRSRPQQEQPPDCEAIVRGRRTGIELTEFMHQPTLEKNIKTNERLPLSPGIPLWNQPNLRARLRSQRFYIWDRDTLRAEMQHLIDEKDLPPEEVKGGPYDQYFLIVHTGEGALGKDNVGAFLQGATFQARFIEHAYFWLPPLLDVPVVFELKLIAE